MDRWEDWPWADPAWLMVPRPEGILFRSGATSHYPTVDIELWTGTPLARDNSGWEAIDEAPFTVDGNSAEAQVRLWCIGGGGNLTGLHLPTQRPLRLRARVAGRDEAEQRTDEFFSGVEQWLLEIFPDGDTITTHLWH